MSPGWYLPPNASTQGAPLDSHLSLNLWIAVALLTLAHLILFVGLLLRRRAEARSSNLIEYIPLTALAILFAFLTLRAERLWAATRYVGAAPSALQVEATGMQFAWYFRYPGKDYAFGRTRPELAEPGNGNPLGLDPTDPTAKDDLVTSELVLPAGREVDLHLHAQDVIHGFSVPAMRVKQNAVPGQSIHIHFTPSVPGTYAILCTQLCGLGHYRMTANLRVLPPEEFAAWLRAKEAAVQP
ncbi:cytochrome c oxidase subunit II [Granulicella tundricola]|uniref:cytochrome-c oxidase n=1 Tax=Granulicella tundricola (strain ATCC BAA-1859 / DSM 23138 / MP5ACTX9) TaxID=1198114 RepID=E8WWZ5_GRATM|nr:cytochrome c oxidase subunit II [Granulicella tundricola]ADW68556.1 cytochrome c oxidase subunit II [Granulicella tundricola MP5ACTX9]